jgi:hypothetical protein
MMRRVVALIQLLDGTAAAVVNSNLCSLMYPSYNVVDNVQ